MVVIETGICLVLLETRVISLGISRPSVGHTQVTEEVRQDLGSSWGCVDNKLSI